MRWQADFSGQRQVIGERLRQRPNLVQLDRCRGQDVVQRAARFPAGKRQGRLLGRLQIAFGEQVGHLGAVWFRVQIAHQDRMRKVMQQFGEGDSALAVMIAHLSLSAPARTRQLGFIAELLHDFPHAILMGDLNTEPHSTEMTHLFAKCNLQPPVQSPPTFPSWKPRRALDHILTSAAIQLDKVWALPQAFSDHLSLAAEIRLPAHVGGTTRSRQ
jgi:hypothetical protein